MSVVEERTETTVAPPGVTRRDVLHRAADILEEFGWRPGAGSQWWHLREPTCLLGAVARARWDFGDPMLPPTTVRYAFGFEPLDHMFADDYDAHTWNDEPGRTKAEVVARLREAAEAA